MAHPRSPWLLLDPSCSFWFLMSHAGSSRLPIVSPHSSYPLLESNPPSSFCVLLGPPSPPGSSWPLLLRERSSWPSWILLDPPGSSWILLASPGSNLLPRNYERERLSLNDRVSAVRNMLRMQRETTCATTSNCKSPAGISQWRNTHFIQQDANGVPQGAS